MNDVMYNPTIREWIIANLDGWSVICDITHEHDEVETEVETETNINPYMTTTELENNSNKKIKDSECKLFYEEALDLAYMHTNRLNINDLSSVEANVFLRGVCKWAASNLWNKYNIRVNNEDMEDTYVQSYGGLLYKSALNTLQQFINQRISSVSRIKENTDENIDDMWVM